MTHSCSCWGANRLEEIESPAGLLHINVKQLFSCLVKNSEILHLADYNFSQHLSFFAVSERSIANV